MSDGRETLVNHFILSFGLERLDRAGLDLALTHRSYAYEMSLPEDNERLEFLGDALISAVTTEYLYESDQEAAEGALSKQRAKLVSRVMLGRRAVEMGLGDLILLGKGEREAGGTTRLSTLGSALEALVGVIYLRLGFEAMRDFVRRHVMEHLMLLSSADETHGDFKSQLQEWAQRILKVVPVYRRLGEEGPDHNKVFYVEVEIGGRVLAKGSGRRLKAAENEAARQALAALEVEP